jgi:hypothetical protein
MMKSETSSIESINRALSELGFLNASAMFLPIG